MSCLCESEPASLPVTTKTVGTDVGLKNLFVTDTGFKTGNPRHTAKYAKRLALLQRRLSRTQKGSKNRARGRLKVARLHAKIAGCRMDNRHRLSRKRINGNQLVCVESLKVKNMFRNQNLSKAIADASRGERVASYSTKANGRGAAWSQSTSFSRLPDAVVVAASP